MAEDVGAQEGPRATRRSREDDDEDDMDESADYTLYVLNSIPRERRTDAGGE
jgi:hypothetical protein